MTKLVSQIYKEIKDELSPEYPFLKKYEVKNIEDWDYYYQECLGLYENGSVLTGKAIIKLNMPLMKEESKKLSMPLYDIIFTTILHEIGHSIQQLNGKRFDEEEAEDFAYNYWCNGILNKIGKKK